MARRRADDEDDAFDGRGVLRDGRSFRVTDSAPYFDAWQDEAKEQLVRAADTRDDAALRRPGFRYIDGGNEGDKLVRDGLRELREDAYAARDAEMTSAWRGGNQPLADAGPPGAYPYTASAEGASCTIGFPGTLVRQGNWLVCQPDDQADSDAQQDKQMQARDRREAIYDKYRSDLENAWRSQ